ncbi:hypothetical protein [Pedobacter sp. SYP-B3415]|uniref:hypothetical protein n=1 Tax=Pedobacter sp. SYP-B3415 TaxID=2496641 RepID=UPI00101C6D70|nr:hypothetical protein [Pedobacter sp. SYP-B3415]
MHTNQIPEQPCFYCGAENYHNIHTPFCSADCRNIYLHGSVEEKPQKSGSLSAILSRIRLNYAILKQALERRMILRRPLEVAEADLKDQGFAPDYFTGIRVDSEGLVTYYCYELGWTRNKNGSLLLADSAADVPTAIPDIISYRF